MRKWVAGVVLASTCLFGASPLIAPALADEEQPAVADEARDAANTVDPVLCFVASQAILAEAIHEFQEGHLLIGELRGVLVGTASFLLDCLTP